MSSAFTLYIGSKNISSWSMRPWLALKHAGVDFREVLIPLDQPGAKTEIRKISPSGWVPALHHGDLVIWESIAICEYAAELFPEAKLWPAERQARAVARSLAAEMHAGFSALRSEMSMRIAARASKTPSALARADIDRVLEIWLSCRERYGREGDFLFGHFTVVDAMYAPVVTRFETYGVELPSAARTYADRMLALPAMREWIRGAHAEAER
ncbi:MAG: glutathione S-transferase family protein [Deltaproteobacteria bacterium]|nr:glutathione S-transferase family protein [Deltaproteobacteria bacterium]